MIRAPFRTIVLAGLTALLGAGFVALGWWQLERRAWKIDLIDRVEGRIDAEPVAVPDPDDRPDHFPEDVEYLRVAVEGRFLDREALVQAVSERGGGYWVLSPLAIRDGGTILVNRGFVPAGDRTTDRNVPDGEQRIVGLLRVSEPDGGFLRANDPGSGRWYSRDVSAIARSMELPSVMPYFVDAEAGWNGGGAPVGGLTVVRFRNTHLVYALTWFTLAAMSLGATVFVLRTAPTPVRDAGMAV